MSAATKPVGGELQTLKDLIALFEGLQDNILKQMGMKWIVEPEPIRRARAILAAAGTGISSKVGPSTQTDAAL